MATLKETLKHLIPTPLLNQILLNFPQLYRTSLVDYETNLRPEHGIEDLLSQLELSVQVAGDIIECGASRCGSTVLLAQKLRTLGVSRKVYACDSFAGFDLDELRRERAVGLTNSQDSSFTSTSYNYVQTKLRRLGVDDLVVPVPGYFQQTLPDLTIKFCMVFIDCDLQDSLTYCARTLWPRLTSGGRMLFDDYTSPLYKGAQLGINRFIAEYSVDIIEHRLLNRLYLICKK